MQGFWVTLPLLYLEVKRFSLPFVWNFLLIPFRMSWEMQYCLYLQTSKIFPMQWMLLKLPTNLACTHSGSATGKHSLHWFADRTRLLLHAYLFGCVICLPSFFLSRYIQSTCATSGEGLYEGLDWLSNNIANKVISTLRCIQFSHTICLVLVAVFDHFLTQWPAGINVGVVSVMLGAAVGFI